MKPFNTILTPLSHWKKAASKIFEAALMLIRNMIGKEMYQFFKSIPFEEVDAIIFLDIWAFMANKRDRSPNFEEPVLKDMVNIARISLRRSYWRNPQL